MKEMELRNRKERLLAYANGNNQFDELDLHEADIAEVLLWLWEEGEEESLRSIAKALPPEILGATILELPEMVQNELIELTDHKIWSEAINELDSDDATDLAQLIQEVDEEKFYQSMASVEEEQKSDIEKLLRFEEDSAGSIMQTELFSAKMDEVISHSIDRLKKLIKEKELSNIHNVFVVDDQNRLKAVLSLEALIQLDFTKTYADHKDELEDSIYVYGNDPIEVVTQKVEKYDLSVVPVVDSFGHLLGRITSDDIYDLIEEQATDQIYALARVDGDEEMQDGVVKTGVTRAKWLLVNFISATMAAVVISFFEGAIEKIVALAILMPIVASMGGTSGTQTITVTVRQLALGNIKLANAKNVIAREVQIALLNGLFFGALASVMASVWFDIPMLGVVIAIAMFANLIYAGLFGAAITLLMKRLDIDPAVASNVFLIMITDMAGFFTFLGLATLVLL